MSFEDFDQPKGLTMNRENRRIKKAELISWSEFEQEYEETFLNTIRIVAKIFRMAFGSLLIQKEYGYSNEETVNQIQENPYVCLPGYQDAKPFDSSLMLHFRRRLPAQRLIEINE